MALAKSYELMLFTSLQNFANATGLPIPTQDSVTYNLIAESTRHAYDNWVDFADREDQFNLSTASGSGLDALGDFLGVTRTQSRSGYSSTSGMRFWTAAAAPSAITIPASTQVWVAGDPSTYFLTREATTIPIGGTEAFTSIIAPESGTYYSATPGMITVHGLAPAVTVYCSNLEAVAGSDEEDDDSYRYRLSQARSIRNLNLPGAVHERILAYPGVLDARILPTKRGAGTVDVLVYTTELIPTTRTLAAIQDYVSTELVAWGIVPRVVGPTVKRLSLTLRMTPFTTLTSSQQQTLRDQLKAQTYIAINNLDLGEAFQPLSFIQDLTNQVEGLAEVALIALTVDGRELPVETIHAGPLQRLIAETIEVR